MLYQISHTTEYLYDQPVGFTPQVIRLFPRMDNRIRMMSYTLKVFPEGDLYWLRDPYDNAIAKFFTTTKCRQLSVSVSAKIEHRQESAFDFLLDSHAIQFPFGYTHSEKEVLQPYLSDTEPAQALVAWLNSVEVTRVGDTTTCLTSLVQQIHQSISYQRRDQPGIQTPATTLQARSGSCRDYAVLLMAVCNHLGLATRFVSGYLHASTDDADTRGADALHAWADVYLPGAGWRGLDPTNGIWCSHSHIPLAVSRNPLETTPVEGSYCADHVVSSSMKTRLNIQNPSCKDAHK
ncbi:MAG: transglutaminase family protein [Verrucomicrobiota bacterium]